MLDGSKTGLRVKPEVLKKDQRKYSSTCKWKEKLEGDDEKESHDNKVYAKRDGVGNRAFIMDQLQAHAKTLYDLVTAKLEQFFKSKFPQVDEELKRPWLEACARADQASRDFGENRMRKELEKIKEHVETLRQEHRDSVRHSLSCQRKGASFTDLPIEQRQDLLRRYSRMFAAAPTGLVSMSPSEAAHVKASYAYTFDAESTKAGPKWTRFPWDVAMRDLCEIKAKQSGSPMTVSGHFWERMKVSSK